ncbi:MAG: DUF1553 domain-containing protein [Planctomycetales bacterium]|nr:DUF1553 domain-containing protein [Planctomycetales bacterium]
MQFSLMRKTLLGLALFASTIGLAATLRAADRDEGLELFESKIRPVLVKRCYECHSEQAARVRGGLRVDVREGLRKGGDSGEPAVVPGEVDQGTLLGALRHESYEMPPDGKLPDTVVADFARWIRLGAPDPRDGAAEKPRPKEVNWDEARQRWAFIKPQRIAPPAVTDPSESALPLTDIDRFLLERMEREGLEPAPEADPYTLLRRLTFDLTGLPPTPEAVRRFTSNPSPQAWEAEVDRLLDSRAFAERWGRHWLDVARFAESSGGGRSLMFPHAWRFRDYVISSFERDKPFDQFLTEQIAGDLLPYESPDQRDDQLIGSGYLILGAINYELQDKELLEMEVIDEQLETIGRGFLAMTMSCARCHDHKFDPISMRDYYSLAGIFSSTEAITPGNVSGYVTEALGSDEERQHRQEHERLVAAAKQRVSELQSRLKGQRERKPSPGGVVVDNQQAQLEGQWKSSTHTKPFEGEDYVHDMQEGKGRNRAVFTTRLPAPGKYEVYVSYTPGESRATKVPVTIGASSGEVRVTMNQREAPTHGPYVLIGQFDFGAEARVVVTTEGTEGFHVTVDAVRWVAADLATGDARAALEGDDAITVRERLRRELDAAKQEVARLEGEAPPAAPVAMCVRDRAHPADDHLRIRGQVRSLGDLVPRGWMSVIELPESEHITIPADVSGRLQLAQWLTSPSHPLTSRVMANRIWKHLMGEGIVATLDNFGSMGEPPTHPELLDHLAITFREDGWSIKRLIRRIVTTRAYRRSSEATDQQIAKDPENHWLARARRRRLDAEALRDSMLAVSDLLKPFDGGRTITKLSAYDLGYQFGDVRERSVYVPAFRNARLELLEVFDAANPNLVTGRRAVSTLPTQALFLLNSPFVQQQSEAIAKRLLQIAPDRRLEEAFLLLLQRPACETEMDWARGIVDGVDPADEAERWSRFAQLLLASVDYRYLY